MKKLLIGLLLSVFMVGCISGINANMRTGKDPITGNIIYYGYSWTTGSEELTNDFNKTTSLSSTLILNSVTKENKMQFSVTKTKGIGTAVSLLTTKEEEFVEKLNGEDSYTINIESIRITNGKDDFIVDNLENTKRVFDGIGTTMGHSTVTFLIQDKDLEKLGRIYNSERVILVARDIYGKDHLGLVKDKSGMLELLNLIKTN
jgi:hypothetical protein